MFVLIFWVSFSCSKEVMQTRLFLWERKRLEIPKMSDIQTSLHAEMIADSFTPFSLNLSTYNWNVLAIWTNRKGWFGLMFVDEVAKTHWNTRWSCLTESRGLLAWRVVVFVADFLCRQPAMQQTLWTKTHKGAKKELRSPLLNMAKWSGTTPSLCPPTPSPAKLRWATSIPVSSTRSKWATPPSPFSSVTRTSNPLAQGLRA